MSERDKTIVVRPPWTATGAALIAFAALFVTGGSVVPVLLGVALVLTYLVDARLDDRAQTRWVVRLAALGVVAAWNNVQPANNDGLFNGSGTQLLGHLAGAELALQCWRRRTGSVSEQRAGLLLALVVLSAWVFLAAGNTFETHFIPYAAPAYVLFIGLSLRAYRARAVEGFPLRDAAKSSPAAPARFWVSLGLRGLALALALGLGGATYAAFSAYRSELTQWGMRLLDGQPLPEGTGMASTPTLGRTFGLQGSRARVLRIENFAGDGHLRGMSFDTYQAGQWGPSLSGVDFKPVGGAPLLRPPVADEAAGALLRSRVTRLSAGSGLLFAPLHVAGLRTQENVTVQWATGSGGPLRTEPVAPYRYTLSHHPRPDYQGLLCAPPAAAERARYLQVGPEIDRRVRALSQRIARPMANTSQKIKAVEAYLLTHHRYSLTTDPGPGDPVSNFLLEKKDAHCEYFGSAAVILLRCVGVPARYVTGYYAHEGGDEGVTVVRQRDAHAWAEAWVAGIGWRTVDATPGDGRPDALHSPIPAWLSAWEKLQDRVLAWRARLSEQTAEGVASAAAAGAAVFLLWLGARRLRSRSKMPATWAYASPSAELRSLAADFERRMRRRGVLFPTDRTWGEHLRALSDEAVPVNTAAAQAFVQTYNAFRFGEGDSDDAVRTLRALLGRLDGREPVGPGSNNPAGAP